MQLIFFTKFLHGLTAAEIAREAGRLGVEGLDLAVRAGHAINPSNVSEALPTALKVWRDAGLMVPLVTLEGTAVEPDAAEVENIFAACGEAGIPFIKLGYWFWDERTHYWDKVEAIRRALSKFQMLGERHGVCSLVHTHSDHFYGSNVSGAMHLLRNFDPRYVGLYIDPAHLALDGEFLPMALDIGRDYLKMVAAKNARYLWSAEKQRWTRDWCSLAEGLAHWPETIGLLRRSGYDGALSLHGEYSASEETAEVLGLAAQDAAYLRSLL